MSECCECGAPATWVRHTQFAGSHPFCEAHACAEKNFGESDDSHFAWEKLSVDPLHSTVQKHPIDVAGYSGTLKELAHSVLSMRYDKVAEFFGYCAVEFKRQSIADFMQERNQLANLLAKAAFLAELQQTQLKRIWRLCKQHVDEKLKINANQ